MSPMERQGRILLAAGVGALFVTVFISMIQSEVFVFGITFAAALSVMGLLFFLRGRRV